MHADDDINMVRAMLQPDALSPRQVRAARALLGLKREELAEKAGIAPRTLVDFELDARAPTRATRRALHSALVQAGIVLLDREGVCLRAA